MPFDFETIWDRTGKDATACEVLPAPGGKVRPGVQPIPMWVADMAFATAPGVVEAMRARLEHPLFGYFPLRQEYFDAIIRWQNRRNGVKDLVPAHIGYENGVVGGLASAVAAFTSPGDGVLVHAPTYIGFLAMLKKCGRRPVFSPLVRDADGVWRMDYDDMDRKLTQEPIHTVIFCSPHNPTGRVWTQEEIARAMAVYAKHDCVVLSDEIWSDLVLAGHRHVPTQSVSEDARMRTAAYYAPSKTFNLAGLVGAYHIIYNPCLRDRAVRQAETTMYNNENLLSMYALMGGYTDEGAAWVDALREVLTGNMTRACDFFAHAVEGISFARPEGTYMLFLDCEAWCAAHGKTIEELLLAGVREGVIWQDGRPFQGPWSIRMNLALPRARLEEALRRLETGVFGSVW